MFDKRTPYRICGGIFSILLFFDIPALLTAQANDRCRSLQQQTDRCYRSIGSQQRGHTHGGEKKKRTDHGDGTVANREFTSCVPYARQLREAGCLRRRDHDYSRLARRANDQGDATRRSRHRMGDTLSDMRGGRRHDGYGRRHGGDWRSRRDTAPSGERSPPPARTPAYKPDKPSAFHPAGNRNSPDRIYGENLRNNQFPQAYAPTEQKKLMDFFAISSKPSATKPPPESLLPKTNKEVPREPVPSQESTRGPAKQAAPQPEPLPYHSPSPASVSRAEPEIPQQASLLPSDDPLPPLPLPPAPAPRGISSGEGDPFMMNTAPVAAPSPPPSSVERRKQSEDEELRSLPDVKLEEPESAGKIQTAENKKEEKEEKGFFGKLSDTVFSFFGFGEEEENTAMPEETLAEKQFDPLAKPEDDKKTAEKKESEAEETLKSEKWFGEEKAHNPEAKAENPDEYKIADPVFGEKPKENSRGPEEETLAQRNQELPIIVLSGNPKFDPSKVAEQLHEIEKTEVKRSMASKTLEELALEANLQKAVPLEDSFIEDPEESHEAEPYHEENLPDLID